MRDILQAPRAPRASRLLQVDWTGGAIVGVLVLVLCTFLSRLHHLPLSLIIFMGIANLLYASYSFSLTRRARRTKNQILFLVCANVLWGVFCFYLLFHHFATASIFGQLTLFLEGLYVAGLGLIEYRWRDALVS